MFGTLYGRQHRGLSKPSDDMVKVKEDTGTYNECTAYKKHLFDLSFFISQTFQEHEKHKFSQRLFKAKDTENV